jgi:mitochondrial GTPase 1
MRSSHLGALNRWRTERVRLSEHAAASSSHASARVAERIVVFNKRDLVPEWGIAVMILLAPQSFLISSPRAQPFQKAMAAKFPEQRTIFVSWNRPKDLKAISGLLVSMSACSSTQSWASVYVSGTNRHRSGAPTYTRVKCTCRWHAKCRQVNTSEFPQGCRYPPPCVCFCHSLSVIYSRSVPICPATPKALRTSAQPGLTRVLSTRLKLSEDPLVYSFDTPGVMLPFLGHGDRGAERGVKLALIGTHLRRIGTFAMH